MQAPNGGMTYEDKRQRNIELGQDINNAWNLVAADYAGSDKNIFPKSAEEKFKNLFPMVRSASQWAREHGDDQKVPVPSQFEQKHPATFPLTEAEAEQRAKQIVKDMPGKQGRTHD